MMTPMLRKLLSLTRHRWKSLLGFCSVVKSLEQIWLIKLTRSRRRLKEVWRQTQVSVTYSSASDSIAHFAGDQIAKCKI